MLGVVLYHTGVGFLGGGYAGVDVFFVLSGYLITDGLWRELEKRRSIAFAAFYGRRARRLLPAAALVTAVTVLASARWQSPIEARIVAKDAIACALYVANFRFALLKTNYLTATAAPSPLQHYWSLAVEEQFYLVWPALLFGGALLWKKASRSGAIATIAVVSALSLGLCIRLTHTSQPWAFFSLPTRAWELGAGALVALTAPTLRTLGRHAATAIGWAGLAAVGATFLVYSSSTAFPGAAAVLPVAGAAAVVAAGLASPPEGPERVLRWRPFQVMGRISYAWYLWHFPVLILAPALVGHSLGLPIDLALAALSGALAMASTVLVENPVRYSDWVKERAARSLALGGGLSLAVLLVTAGVVTGLPSLKGHGIATVGALTPATNAAQTAVLAGLEAKLPPVMTAAVHQNVVPANLDPPLGRAGTGLAAPFVDGCLDSFTDSALHGGCQFGDTQSTTSVVLFGDSHAAMWFPALDAMANARKWNLVVMTKATCPPLAMSVFSPELGRQYTECDRFRAAALQRIASLHPAVVVLGVARHYTSLYHFQVYGPAWSEGLTGMVRTLRASGTKVMVLGPVPKPGTDMPQCLSAHLNNAIQCTQPIQRSIFDAAGMSAERAAVTAAGGTYVDVEPWMCTQAVCAVMVGNLLVFRDDNHLAAGFVNWLTPLVTASVDVATH